MPAILRTILVYLIARLREPSTLRGLIYLATGFGLLNLDASQSAGLADQVISLFGHTTNPVDITGSGFIVSGLAGLLPDRLGR